ncbi:MAG: DUF2961 domain-containing protein [Armatimonadota bacterium]|nr:DUF2961 domain-containing protein [Armatimonadota bacterium]
MRQLLAIITLVVAAFIPLSSTAAPVVTGDLSELIDPERAAYLRDSECAQVSSYDRTGGNDDGFSGEYSFIRKEGENFVIFDAKGPGCIYRLWSANPLKGWVNFYFDGEETPRLQLDHFEDMFKDVKYPFVPPLSQHFLGGWCSYVPMPFTKSLKIVAKGPVRFLQITWHKFPSDEGIKSFDPNFSQAERIKLARVKKAWTNLGEPPAAFPMSAQRIQKTLTVKPNSTGELAKLTGAGLIRGLKMKAQSADAKGLRKSLLLVNVDGQKDPNVYSPIGDFFLDPFGSGISQSIVAGKANDSYYSYWVMPYASGASVKVRNDSPGSPLILTYEIVYEPMKKLPDGMGRFFAWWHRQNPTIKGELFPILDATGQGQWCGVSHAMQGGGDGLGFLEGDEMAWIDGRDNSFYNGTGTEDYFNGGWYFGGTGSAPFYGCGFHAGWGKCHAYRLQLTDLVPFQQNAKIGIEHGHGNSIPADYAGVTYWYAAPGTKHAFKPAVVADRIDRPAAAMHVVEAETIYDPQSGGAVVDDVEAPFYLSAGKGVSTKGNKPGESFSLNINAPYTDAFEVEMAFMKGPNGGIAQVIVDDKVIGEADTYASNYEARSRVRVGFTPELYAGKHKLTVKSTGKNDASSGTSVLVDFIMLRPGRNYEGELLEVTETTGGNDSRQDLGDEFSNGGHLWFTAGKVGAKLTAKIPVRVAGKFPISAYLTKSGDYGIVQLSLDGKPLGQPFDGYNDGVTRKLVKFGEMEFTAGDHIFTMEIVGKNDKSTGYMAGLDMLSLK